MPEINATKKDLLKAIRKKCNECMSHVNYVKDCTSTNCPLYPYRLKSTKEADQMHLFRVCNKEDFLEIIEKSASKFEHEGFFWSELRKEANCKPLNDNWWGGATNRLKKLGYVIVDGHRRSEIKSRNGATDRKWKKIK